MCNYFESRSSINSSLFSFFIHSYRSMDISVKLFYILLDLVRLFLKISLQIKLEELLIHPKVKSCYMNFKGIAFVYIKLKKFLNPK